MSRHRDVLRVLSEARPAQLDRGPRPIDLAAVTAFPQEAGDRANRRRLVLTAGLVPAVAAAAAVTVMVAQSPATPTPQPTLAQRPTPADTPTTARGLLLVAAEQVADDQTVGGRYWVTRIENGETRQVGPKARPYDVVLRMTEEKWLASSPKDKSWVFFQSLGAAPATAADKDAWRQDGFPAQWTEPAPKGMKPVVISAEGGPRLLRTPGGLSGRDVHVLGGQPITSAELSALPADSAALKAYLVKRYKDTGGLEGENDYLFNSADALVLDLPVTPEVRAVAYKLIAGLKGITTLGSVTDQHGRKGVAVAYTRRGDSGALAQTRLIIDPRTGHALAEESWSLGARDKLMSYTLVLGAAWSDDTPPAK
ncbi:hypothetical protein GCM10023194_80420 [Planotetraspora phitsanulokensis]|uniref:CU044_5270 family protein n=1 Tax=Planotetraspora phitsanulokensis TaxID=575192 RepID=A0A8J3XHS9_9ACTN|nr:CU044_5270 family protein [Planotetraspora phitsanulokensis]GII41629.1 hypothetical protein Pph01_66320 [Planotetraspora phitsanulokensis]